MDRWNLSLAAPLLMKEFGWNETTMGLQQPGPLAAPRRGAGRPAGHGGEPRRDGVARPGRRDRRPHRRLEPELLPDRRAAGGRPAHVDALGERGADHSGSASTVSSMLTRTLRPTCTGIGKVPSCLIGSGSPMRPRATWKPFS